MNSVERINNRGNEIKYSSGWRHRLCGVMRITVATGLFYFFCFVILIMKLRVCIDKMVLRLSNSEELADSNGNTDSYSYCREMCTLYKQNTFKQNIHIHKFINKYIHIHIGIRCICIHTLRLQKYIKLTN